MAHTRHHILCILFSVGFFLSVDVAAHEIELLSIKDVDFTIDRNADANLKMTINPSRLGVASESEMRVTPVLLSADSASAWRYPSVTVAGRNRMLRYKRGQRALPEGGTLYSSGHDTPVNYNSDCGYQEWMSRSTLYLDVEENGCCGKRKQNYRIPVAAVDLSGAPEFQLPDDFDFGTDAVAAPKITELKGSAFIDFRVNRTEIDPSYRRNVSELTKIIRTIDAVRENPDATITYISIKGFASPEGSYQNNVRLAKGRTKALKDYVKSEYNFDESLFHTDYEAEDWQGLRDSVAVSNLPSREGLLKIIDSGLAPDARDAALRKRYPEDYGFLLANIYPALRHSDYVVRYEIRQYTTIEDIRRAFRERPENLNEHEVMMLLGSYAPGSDEFDETAIAAAKLFPYNGRLAYISGVAHARRRQYEEARALLEKAASKGVEEATDALQILEETMKPRPKVTYISLKQ